MPNVLEPFKWPSIDAFRNRGGDLKRLDDWWTGPSRDAMCLFGRRRVGKSWLFRAFAHDKPSLILVADRLLAGPQMRRFADLLEEPLGIRPELNDLDDLVRAAYRLGADQQVLVVIDELPYLLPEGAKRERALTSIQRVMEEERDGSNTKLVVCGSLISQMQSLLAQSSPLHGRLARLEVRPMDFAEAGPLLDASDDATEAVVRFAVAGGMARYLAELGHGSLKAAVCRAVLDSRGPLFNDPRAVLEQELRTPATYFSILEELADGEASGEHLSKRTGRGTSALAPYLQSLREMRLISERLPIGAPSNSRGRKYRIDDGFIRFWFRFVFPHQAALEEGLAGEDLWDGEIAEFLPDFVADTFEDLCLRYVRKRFGGEAPNVGAWWGDALDEQRKTKTRMTEEIDVVGVMRRRLRIVGECKWNRRPMRARVLDDLVRFKLPALLREGNVDGDENKVRILLFARAGFDRALEDRALEDERVELIRTDDLVATLRGEWSAEAPYTSG